MSKNIFFIWCATLLFFLFQTNQSKANFNSVYSSDGINIWAAGVSGNVFKSTDGGNTFQSFYVGTSDFNSVFVIGLNIWLASQNGNIVRSTDGGNNWLTTPGFSAVKSLFFVDNLNGFFAGSSGAIYKTINGGANWTQITSGTGNNLNCIKFSDANNGVVCGAYGTALITTNGGSLWTVSNTPVTKELLSIDMKGSTVIASGVDATVLKSTNSGNTWTTIDYKITTQSDVNSVYMQDANTYFSIGGGGFIRKSTDGGVTFTFGINPMLASLNQIYFYDNNKGWAVSPNTNAIIRTTDGGNNWLFPAGTTQSLIWNQKISTSSSRGNTLTINPFNKKEIFVTVTNHIYRSLDKGETWNMISTFNNGYISNSFYISPKDSNLFVVAIDTIGSINYGRILRSTNYGVSWTSTYFGPRESDGTPITIDPNHTDTLYFAPSDTVLLKSSNFGSSWTPAGTHIFHDVCVMKVLEGNSNIILLGNKEPSSGTLVHLFRTTDYGVNWQIVDSATANYNNGPEIPGLATTRYNPNTVYCAYFESKGIIKSTNLGLTWAVFHPDSLAWGIDVAKDDPNAIIYGWAIGMGAVLTTDGGLTFNNYPSGISNGNQSFLYYDRATIIAQQYTGICKLNITYTVPIGIKQISSQVPKSFFLNQNYPNPFNPSTKINYQIPKSGFVKIIVYDVIGKEIAVLVNENQTQGTYEVEFDAANQPSGVYFYKLQTEKYSDTKKMVIVK